MKSTSQEIQLLAESGRSAIVDDRDYIWLTRWKWRCLRIRTKEYAVRSERSDGKRRLIFMHREIMKAQPGELVDHINGNGLDNRRNNLRICNSSQNSASRRILPASKSSRHRGVRRHKARWIAEIRVQRRLINLGSFRDERAAARAYDQAAIAHFGEFARTNFIH